MNQTGSYTANRLEKDGNRLNIVFLLEQFVYLPPRLKINYNETL